MYNNQYQEYVGQLSTIHAFVSMNRQADDERAIQRCFEGVSCGFGEDPILKIKSKWK